MDEFAALRLCEFYFEFCCKFVAAAAFQTCCVFAKSDRACFGRAGAGFSPTRRVAAYKLVMRAWCMGRRLAKAIGDRVLLESERGYNITIPNSGVTLSWEINFAERKFVATPGT